VNSTSVADSTQDQSQEKTEPTADHRPWFVRVPLDHEEILGLPDVCFRMLFILESFWRDKSSCFPSTETLARLCGCGPTKAKWALDWLEGHGWIRRQTTRREKKCRRYIFALKRLDPERPVVEVVDSEADQAKGAPSAFTTKRRSFGFYYQKALLRLLRPKVANPAK
jgi:hypothetical protein